VMITCNAVKLLTETIKGLNRLKPFIAPMDRDDTDNSVITIVTCYQGSHTEIAAGETELVKSPSSGG